MLPPLEIICGTDDSPLLLLRFLVLPNESPSLPLALKNISEFPGVLSWHTIRTASETEDICALIDSPSLLLRFLVLANVEPLLVLTLNNISKFPGVLSCHTIYTLLPCRSICGLFEFSNNATCSQERIISYITQIPLPTAPSQPSAILTIIKHVINDIVGTISVKDITSSASNSNVSPQSSFPGARFPNATVTLKPGIFPVVLLQQANSTTTAVAAAADHNKCSSGDIIICIHNKETHHPAKDTTTPFVLPIPFP
jgi:hypothetical protein